MKGLHLKDLDVYPVRILDMQTGERIVLPHEPSWSRPVYHLFVVRVGERDRVQQQLTAAGVGTGIHYPIPLHLSKAYQDLFYRPGDFPVAERAAREILSLPMFPDLSADSQQVVVAALVEAVTPRRDAPERAEAGAA